MNSWQIYRYTCYTYDANNNLTQVKVNTTWDCWDLTPSASTAMTYDWLGRKLSLSDPDTGYWTYGYDADGNLTAQTDARG